MPKNVQMPDGKIVEFPDNMSDAEVANAIRTSDRPQITQPKPELSKVWAPGEFGKGFSHTIPDMITHPKETGVSMGMPFVATGMAPGGMYPTTAATGRMSDLRANHAVQMAAQEYEREQAKGIAQNPAYAAGGIASQAALGAGLKGLGRVAPIAGEAIRTAAIGDPDVALLKGMRVGPGSPKAQSILRAGQGARPFLQGAQSLEDIQSRFPAAKSEIWGPYKQTVDSLRGKTVNGPDGPTTIGELESERTQLSALNRELKSRTPNPEALQLAQQKGLNQAQLLARERAVQNSLDPVLRDAGIQPKAIRQAFGQVAQIGERVSGKSTLAEPTQRYGFAKAADLSLTRPLSNIGTVGSGIRDIAAGRYFSAKPTDVAIREAFRTGAPKPNFGEFNPQQPGPPPLQLPSSTISNAEFTDYPEALKGQAIEASQRKIAQPEYLSPNPSAIPLNAPPKPVKPFNTDLYLQHLREMQ